jgi:hypothetical protein
MSKPINICGRDGCSNRATHQATLILRGSPVKGATTIRVCERHQRAATEFVLNDENRSRLAAHLTLEGYCDALTAYGMVKHNAAVELDRIAS